MIDLHAIATEQRNEQTRHIDRLSTLDMIRLINEEDTKAALAVGAIAPAIADAVDLIAGRLRQGGRLFYIGSGTSGRLGILDAVECPPTYSTDPTWSRASSPAGTKPSSGPRKVPKTHRTWDGPTWQPRP